MLGGCCRNDPELIYAPGGVLEALTKAKQQGKVRFVGFDGHKHSAIHLEMLFNRGLHSLPSPFLRYEPSGGHNHQRNGFHGSPQPNLAILCDFKPLSPDGIQSLQNHGKQFDDGRYEL
jgi:hypothetical protein